MADVVPLRQAPARAPRDRALPGPEPRQELEPWWPGRPGDRTARLAEVGSLIRGAGLTGLVRPASQPVDAPATTNETLPVVPALRPLLPWGGLRRGATLAVQATDVTASGADLPHHPVAPGGRVVRRPATRGPLTSVPGTGPAGPADPAGPATGSPSGSPVGAAGDPAAGGPVPGATTVLFTLLSAASAGGSWCAVAGLPGLGALAAAEAGICLERLALVPHPGPDWPAVVAALLDGFDVVVVAVPGPVGAGVASRLSARARQRGSVLVAAGPWSGAEVILSPTSSTWEGLGQGRGRLTRRELTVSAQGRGAAARPRYAHLRVPGGGATGEPVGASEPTGGEPAGMPAGMVVGG